MYDATMRFIRSVVDDVYLVHELLADPWSFDNIMEDEMGGKCGMYGREKKNV